MRLPLPTSRILVDETIPDEQLDRIVALVHDGGVIPIESYRNNYLKRRLFLRMRALGIPTIEAYREKLAVSPVELRLFKNMLSINVSTFFRNPDVYDVLRDHVFPSVFRLKTANTQNFLRILSVGCASGEEAYSVAIMLREHFPNQCLAVTPHILGLDVDARSIKLAHDAVYDVTRMGNLSQDERHHYFHKVGERRYALDESVKKMVVFKVEDVIKKGVTKFWDVILCRNLLIYLTREAQHDLLMKLYHACADGGFLVLGKSEAPVGAVRDLLPPAYPQERIYVKKRSHHEHAS